MTMEPSSPPPTTDVDVKITLPVMVLSPASCTPVMLWLLLKLACSTAKLLMPHHSKAWSSSSAMR